MSTVLSSTCQLDLNPNGPRMVVNYCDQCGYSERFYKPVARHIRENGEQPLSKSAVIKRRLDYDYARLGALMRFAEKLGVPVVAENENETEVVSWFRGQPNVSRFCTVTGEEVELSAFESCQERQVVGDYPPCEHAPAPGARKLMPWEAWQQECAARADVDGRADVGGRADVDGRGGRPSDGGSEPWKKAG